MDLQNISKFTKMAQSHKGIEPFHYDFCVDWAVDLLLKGIDSKNVEMLASFSKPVDSWGIKTYVSEVLKEFKLKEFEGKEAVDNFAFFYINSIILDEGNLLSHIENLCEICIENDYDDDLFPFYLLKFSWDDLEFNGDSYHYEGVTFENFKETARKDAKIWMEDFNQRYNASAAGL